MKAKPKCIFYCQYIRGIGHLVRTVELIRYLLNTFEVCLITGGESISGFQFPESIKIVYLPAIKGDEQNNELKLKTVDPTLNIEDCKQIRTQIILDTVNNFKPDLLVIEHFPFGSMFSFELIPLLEFIRAKHQATKIICSLRDVVLIKQGDINDLIICNTLNQYFDLLLIHGDPNFIKLDESFSRFDDIKCPVKYTGYVTRQINKHDQQLNSIKNRGYTQILVSIGGGRVGYNLLESLIYSSPALSLKIEHKILIFTGPFMPEEQFIQLQHLSSRLSHIEIYRYTPNLIHYMYESDISISMAGYNTIADILVTRIPSLLFIFDFQYQDDEQKIRAEKLEQFGIVDIIRSDELQSDLIANKIYNHLQKKVSKLQVDLDGAKNTALFLIQLI